MSITPEPASQSQESEPLALAEPLSAERRPYSSDRLLQENPLHLLAHRIADPRTTVEEAILLTRVRQELIRQEEAQKDQQHVRKTETRQYYGKMGFSGGAVLIGLGLVVSGHPIEGFAVMGVGFHWLAPDFVTSVWDRILGKSSKGKDQNAD